MPATSAVFLVVVIGIFPPAFVAGVWTVVAMSGLLFADG